MHHDSGISSGAQIWRDRSGGTSRGTAPAVIGRTSKDSAGAVKAQLFEQCLGWGPQEGLLGELALQVGPSGTIMIGTGLIGGSGFGIEQRVLR